MVKKKIIKKKKPRPTTFKAGNKASVGHGRPKMTDAQKALALTNRTQFKNLLVQYSALDLDKIEELLLSRKLPVIDLAILKNIHIAMTTGDSSRIDWTLDHIMGAPSKETTLRLTGNMTNTSIDVNNLNKEQLLALKDIAIASGKKGNE